MLQFIIGLFLGVFIGIVNREDPNTRKLALPLGNFSYRWAAGISEFEELLEEGIL